MTDITSKNQFRKVELGTIFIERSLKLLANNGFLSFVSPQNWLFPNNYIHFRRELLIKNKWAFIARLGTRAFITISGEIVNVGLFGFFNSCPKETDLFFGIDVSNEKNPFEKANALKSEYPRMITQKSQLDNNESRITLNENTSISLVSKYAKAFEGSSTGDKDRFLVNFWEITFPNLEFEFFQFSSDQNTFNSGNNGCIRWQQGIGILSKYSGARIQGLNAFRKRGILVGRVGEIKIGYYSKQFFDKSCVAIIPDDVNNLDSLFCFFSSAEFVNSVKSLDPRLSVATSVFEKVPFDLEYWQKVAEEKYPNGLPKPYSDDATQWLFHGHPIKAENPLQVAVARLLGYRWPAENDREMELADEARELIKAVKAFDELTDDDGIFCIPSVNAEQAGADRLRSYLQAVFGSEWNNQTIGQLLTQEGATSANLEDWLRKEFFVQHCKVFQNRPFIWHIWDGRNDGFSALVNYHKLTKENLVKLTYTYLGDWIRMCDAKKKSGESGADGLYSAAIKLQEKLISILEGEAPYDIFVRWKPLEQQPIGWEPDLNDGVRLNICPFIEAGVLRSKFNLKWGIDRGKNPPFAESSKNLPGSYFSEIRNNDKHIPLAEKRAARENKK